MFKSKLLSVYQRKGCDDPNGECVGGVHDVSDADVVDGVRDAMHEGCFFESHRQINLRKEAKKRS